MPLLYLLIALLVWPLVAFGGRSAATAIAFGLSCLVLVAFVRGRSEYAGPLVDRRLERALLALVMIVALTRVPLPSSIVAIVSPHAAAVRSALSLGDGAPGAFLPLTIDSSDTTWAWMVLLGATAFFFVARALFRRGGVRRRSGRYRRWALPCRSWRSRRPRRPGGISTGGSGPSSRARCPLVRSSTATISRRG